MSCDCQAQCGNSGPWSVTLGDSFAEYFDISSGCPPQPVGDNTWGAEFGLMSASNPQQNLLKIMVNDGTNQLFWSQPGRLNLLLKQDTTKSLQAYTRMPGLRWYLAVVAPSPYDPAGFRMTVAQGSMVLKQPGQQQCDELMYGRALPCPAGANVDRYCGAYGAYGYGLYGGYGWPPFPWGSF